MRFYLVGEVAGADVATPVKRHAPEGSEPDAPC